MNEHVGLYKRIEELEKQINRNEIDYRENLGHRMDELRSYRAQVEVLKEVIMELVGVGG